MRFAGLFLVAAAAVVLTGCSDLVSLNGFATDKDLAADPGLAGTFKDSDGKALYIIQQSGSDYSITYTEQKEKTAVKFTGRLIKAGDAEILDLAEDGDDSFQIPVHTIVRVWPEGSVLRWTFLDSKWLREQATMQLTTQPSGDRTLITAPQDTVRAFVLKYGGDPKAYGKEINLLTRVQ